MLELRLTATCSQCGQDQTLTELKPEPTNSMRSLMGELEEYSGWRFEKEGDFCSDDCLNEWHNQ